MAPYNNAPESGTRNGRPAAGRGAGAGALVGSGLFVGLIALCALVISYNGIFQFAEYGGHEGSPLAHVFPVTYTLLLMMACWVSYLLRGAPPRERLWVDLVLIPVLVLFAAAAMLLSSLELVERVHQGVANVIVAVAPLAALLVAFLLWMTLRAHMRRRRTRMARPRPADDPTTVLHARTTVPPRRDTAPLTASEGGTLQARLLRLGADDRDEDGRNGADPRTAGPPEASAGSEEFAGPNAPGERLERGRDPEPDTFRNRDEPGRDGWDDEEFAAEPLPVAGTEAPRSGSGDDRDGWDDGDGIEASVPTVRLPRRSRDGHNPIKRAAEEAPVVPGAATPTDVEPEPEPEVEPEPVSAVPDHLADEGFEHEPPFGDPVSDEADAPPVAAEPVAEPEPHAEPEHHVQPEPEPESGTVTAFEPEPEPVEEPVEPRREPAPVVAPEPVTDSRSAPSEPEPEVKAEDGRAGSVPQSAPVPASRSTPVEPDPEPEPDAEAEPSAERAPDTAHWEPPADDSGAHVLADYVPPVWTPPEDDTSPFAEESREPEPTPVLDHDTGPTVRAAFRIGEASPEAVAPSNEPVESAPRLEEAWAWYETDEDRFPEEDPLQEPEPLGEPEPSTADADLPPEAEELPPTVREEDEDEPAPSSLEPPAGPALGAGRPAQERRGPLTPVEKRPMVLKPPRPPLPDFTSGPPSRRVRSEPLRPDE
ncbi:DUF2637 domain-containing protein [Nocardiopsis sp. HUAS JQ3]|uniref:DUF2637 domain-containing protein n=1 Tax=Nocardiopsis sp. HUAS JQ3 TaxID=3061629 RepID=UPI0023A99E8A|nr:DUF2637 domain-containing protein [Nocardiopsis sp. HUAS JQ3]WDZ90426.1 DUF2637 domain-containing protein [Nocardiopsis sp. HUAS JQ3]